MARDAVRVRWTATGLENIYRWGALCGDIRAYDVQLCSSSAAGSANSLTQVSVASPETTDLKHCG